MTEIAVNLSRNIGDTEPLTLVLFNGVNEVGNEILEEVPNTFGRFVADFDDLDLGITYRAVVVKNGETIYDGWLRTAEVDQPLTIEEHANAVLSAAEENPINSNVTQVNGNPANPSTNVAQQTTLLTLVDLVNSLEGEGLYAINVELFSSEGPVGKVIINIVGTNLTRITTNSGKAQFPVNPGTYTLRFDVPYGYTPIPDQSVVVTSADVTKEIEMTLTTVTPPSDPSLCNLYGRVVGSDGARLKDVEVKAILSHMVKNIRDDIPMATLLETKTGEDGTFNLTLMRFASYELTFTTPEARRKTVKVQIGDQPTALISTVIR